MGGSGGEAADHPEDKGLNDHQKGLSFTEAEYKGSRGGSLESLGMAKGEALEDVETRKGDDDLSKADESQAQKQGVTGESRKLTGCFKAGDCSCSSDTRRARVFPPPLPSLARKSSANFPSQLPLVALQPIRSHGRFVLQELKMPKQVMFRPIRSKGRLVLHLKYEEVEEEPQSDAKELESSSSTSSSLELESSSSGSFKGGR